MPRRLRCYFSVYALSCAQYATGLITLVTNFLMFLFLLLLPLRHTRPHRPTASRKLSRTSTRPSWKRSSISSSSRTKKLLATTMLMRTSTAMRTAVMKRARKTARRFKVTIKTARARIKLDTHLSLSEVYERNVTQPCFASVFCLSCGACTSHDRITINSRESILLLITVGFYNATPKM